MEFTNILSESEFSDSDLSLLSWLQVIIVHDVIYILKLSTGIIQSLSPDTFSCPFEQRSLNVDVERIQKPVLGKNKRIFIIYKV